MKADTEKLEQLSMAELITICTRLQGRWDFINYELSEKKNNVTEAKKTEAVKSEIVGKECERLILKKLDDFIKID